MMTNIFFKKIVYPAIILGVSANVIAAAAESEVQDMSDPLAVYTQAGAGYTDKGLNIKIGKSYDPGVADVMAMNLIEIKGIYGETLGTRDNLNDSISLVRFRNFSVGTKNGQGAQIDVEFNLNRNTGSASYAFIQALPKVGIFQFYPLAGVGLAIANNVNIDPLWKEPNSPTGYSIPGSYAVVGMYSRIKINDKIWMNYNPIWLTSLGGSEAYTKNTYAVGKNSVFTHELSLSYQINPRMNVRYFGNWSDLVDFSDGDQRIEINYQF